MGENIIETITDSRTRPAGRSPLKRLWSRLTKDANLDRVLRGGGLVFTLSVAGLALSYVSQVVLARWLGQRQFGIYAYAWSWTHTLAVFGTFGLGQAMLRFFPQYTVRKEWALASGLLRHGRLLVAAIATAIVLVVALVAIRLGGFFSGDYVATLWVAFAAAPLLALLQIQRETARAFGLPVASYLPRTVIFPILIMAGAFGLAMSGYVLSAVTMMAVTFAVLAGIVAVQSRVIVSRIPGEIRQARPRHDIRQWLHVAAPLFITIGCRELLNQASMIMLGIYLMPENVAVYYAAARIAELVNFVLAAVNALGASQIARLHAKGDAAALQRFVTGAVRWIFWPSVGVALLLVVTGEFVLGMFGPDFASGMTVLSILIFGQLVSAAVGPVGYLLSMTGHQGVSAWIFGSTTAVTILLNALLIPTYGIMGAAVATATGITLKNVVAFLFVRRRVNIHSFVFFAPSNPKP